MWHFLYIMVGLRLSSLNKFEFGLRTVFEYELGSNSLPVRSNSFGFALVRLRLKFGGTAVS